LGLVSGERERERDRERERQRDRERQRETERDRSQDRNSESEGWDDKPSSEDGPDVSILLVGEVVFVMADIVLRGTSGRAACRGGGRGGGPGILGQVSSEEMLRISCIDQTHL
jgi:hypothetical protein